MAAQAQKATREALADPTGEKAGALLAQQLDDRRRYTELIWGGFFAYLRASSPWPLGAILKRTQRALTATTRCRKRW
jgi:hypothetical protein